MAAPENTPGKAVGAPQPVRLPKLLSDGEHWSGSPLSRLKEFLTEHPVKVAPVKGPAPFVHQEFGGGFLESLKVAVQAEPRLPKGADAAHLLLTRKSGLQAFRENLRDLISPPKLPPLKLSSKPGPPPKDIWSKDEVEARAHWLSVLVHATMAFALMVPIYIQLEPITQAKTTEVQMVDTSNLSDYVFKLPKGNDKSGGGGGGGERNPIPASKGKLPKFSLQPQLAPPVVVIQNPNPALPVIPTVVVPPDIHVPQPNLPNYGDPLAAMVTNSGGPGSGGGIGTGSGGGVGSGTGPGVGPGEGGGIGGGHFHVGRDGIGEPTCIYCPSPLFTDEARKARHQGTVLLQIVILPDGRTSDVRVLHGLGMGLDEKAVETVRTWRWKPVIGPGGKPVTVDLSIEVSFRLL
jgi:TonB family protein